MESVHVRPRQWCQRPWARACARAGSSGIRFVEGVDTGGRAMPAAGSVRPIGDRLPTPAAGSAQMMKDAWKGSISRRRIQAGNVECLRRNASPALSVFPAFFRRTAPRQRANRLYLPCTARRRPKSLPMAPSRWQMPTKGQGPNGVRAREFLLGGILGNSSGGSRWIGATRCHDYLTFATPRGQLAVGSVTQYSTFL